MSTCSKVTYDDKYQAMRTADQMRRKYKDNRSRNMKAYTCRECGGIHLTSSTFKPPNTRKKKQQWKR